MADKLPRYRGKRDPRRTSEPMPAEGPPSSGSDDTFVIQEHHARSLHWDLRLERDGVLVSWAVPKGLPPDPDTNHLAVRTEDHPMEYATFEGEIPAGEYGGGTMTIWDRGRYVTEKWSDREVKVVLNGSRVSGRYVLFRTRDRNWMIHRMDPPAEGWERPPDTLAPMTPVTRSRAPRDPRGYGWEFAWGGLRAFAHVQGGRLTLRSATGDDITRDHRWLRPMAEAFGSRSSILDGEIAPLAGTPVYIAYDVLHDEGESLLDAPYTARRATLEGMGITGPRWQTAPAWPGELAAVRQAARAQELPGVVGKRLDSPYRPGEESPDWVYLPS